MEIEAQAKFQISIRWQDKELGGWELQFSLADEGRERFCRRIWPKPGASERVKRDNKDKHWKHTERCRLAEHGTSAFFVRHQQVSQSKEQ